MARTPKHKNLKNTRLANAYGGWFYCEGCNETIGYLCYVTYDLFRLDYRCKCGNHGSVDIGFENYHMAQAGVQPLVTIKNRLCCPVDQSPLVTILAQNLDDYNYEIVCKACNTEYGKEQGL